MRRLFAGAVCLLALCDCDSAPQNPADAAIVSPATTPAPPATPPSCVAHEGSRTGPRSFCCAEICDGAQNRLRSWPDRQHRDRRRRPAKAGIVKGDVLLSVDGTPVNSLADLTAAVNAAAPHHSAEFEMSRDGATRDVTIPL